MTNPAPPVSALRVLHIGPLPPPPGGMATVMAQLTMELEGKCALRVLNNVKTTAADRSLWEGIAAQLRMIGTLVRMIREFRPDIVHVHTCSYFTFWRNSVDVILAKVLGRKVVLHIHGGKFDAFLESLNPVMVWLARQILALADSVIVLSQGWRERLAPWCAVDRMAVVVNGVRIPEATTPGYVPGTPVRLVCVAGYDANKNQAALIRAVAALSSGREVSLVLVGAPAEPEYARHLQELAAELGIADRVYLTGPADAARVAEHYQESHIFCLTSLQEGLPVSLLEAMAHGLPVVATAVGAIPEVVTDGVEGFLVQVDDSRALVERLRTLINDSGTARAMGTAGRAKVAAQFGLNQVAANVLALYAAITGDHRQGSDATRSGNRTS